MSRRRITAIREYVPDVHWCTLYGKQEALHQGRGHDDSARSYPRKWRLLSDESFVETIDRQERWFEKYTL
jgi:hypothetical protein